MSAVDIAHDEGARRFVARVGGSEVGHIAYAPRGDALDLMHTEIDPKEQGRGLGSALVRGTLDAVRAEGRRIVPSCPFVAAFLREHREYADLVAER